MYAGAPAQHGVAAESQQYEERAHDNEVDVELGILDVQLLDHVLRLLEDAALLHPRLDVSGRVVVALAVQRVAVVAVDRLNDTLERVPTEHQQVYKGIFEYLELELGLL